MKFNVGDKVKMISKYDGWITENKGEIICSKNNNFCYTVEFPERTWTIQEANLILIKKITIKEINKRYLKHYDDSK